MFYSTTKQFYITIISCVVVVLIAFAMLTPPTPPDEPRTLFEIATDPSTMLDVYVQSKKDWTHSYESYLSGEVPALRVVGDLDYYIAHHFNMYGFEPTFDNVEKIQTIRLEAEKELILYIGAWSTEEVKSESEFANSNERG
jgi:hypothetical protein